MKYFQNLSCVLSTCQLSLLSTGPRLGLYAPSSILLVLILDHWAQFWALTIEPEREILCGVIHRTN